MIKIFLKELDIKTMSDAYVAGLFFSIGFALFLWLIYLTNGWALLGIIPLITIVGLYLYDKYSNK